VGKRGTGEVADEPELMSVALGVEPGAVVVTVTGEIDSTTAPALRTTVTENITEMRAGGRCLVLDLMAVEFFNSSGAALVFDLTVIAAENNVPLYLVLDVTGRVMRTLRITRLAGLLPIYPSQAAALQTALQTP
jgi:anti-anti-sigma factor